MLTPPQAVFAIVASVEATLVSTNFSSTITLGSIVLGVLVLVVAGFFTVRANIARVWHENYDAEVVKRKQAEDRVEELLNELHRERDEQAELRHSLKDEIATAKALLEVEKLKPNLGVIVEMATEHYATAMRDVTAMFDGVVKTQEQMLTVLAQLPSHLDANGPKETA